jgi:hypothetical protein
MKSLNKKIIKERAQTNGRRNFLKSAAIGVMGIAGLGMSLPDYEIARKKPKIRTRTEKLKSIASNSYAVNQLFKRRTTQQRAERPETIELKKNTGNSLFLIFRSTQRILIPG